MFSSASFSTKSFSSKSWLFDNIAVVLVESSGGVWKLHPQRKDDEMDELIPILVDMIRVLRR